MAFQTPDLPYSYDALEPHIDEATMRVHHAKHHNEAPNVNPKPAYVTLGRRQRRFITRLPTP